MKFERAFSERDMLKSYDVENPVHRAMRYELKRAYAHIEALESSEGYVDRNALIRKQARIEELEDDRHAFIKENNELMRQVQELERKLEEQTVELGRVCWESMAKANERDAWNHQTQIEQEKTIQERDALIREAILAVDDMTKNTVWKTECYEDFLTKARAALGVE